MRFFIFYIALLAHTLALSAQDTIINGSDTVLRFYYPEGKPSSEGYIKNGKPDGYWKNYYFEGGIKSEGNRKNNELTGPWRFYDSKGNLTLEINYQSGVKDGIRKTITPTEIIEESFVNNQKEGFTYYYEAKNNYLQKAIPYRAGLKHGIAREYNKEGIIIEITEFQNDKTISIQYVNRTDKSGNKQGKWVQFYSNGNLKSEAYFLNNKLHGFFKIYSEDGNLLKVQKYQNGYLLENAPEVASLDEKISYYKNGTIKRIAHYKDTVLQGIWQEYNEDGTIKESYIFRNGKLEAKGLIDEAGMKQSQWYEYYTSGNLLGRGNYKDGKRVGEWIYYHSNGNIEQIGRYKDGLLSGEWQWFYESGKLLKVENYLAGKLDGQYFELYEDGDTIVNGSFYDDKPDGFWVTKYGDIIEKGKYTDGNRTGLWQSFYSNGILYFEGNYIDGNPDGVFRYYYPNGKLKQQGAYVGFKKQGNWITYNEYGEIILTITYSAGNETNYDGSNIELD